MISIKALINKIKWDKKENPEDYELAYLDRVENKLKKIKFAAIDKVEDNFLIIGETQIPLHRIKVVTKKGVIVWRREF